MIISKTDVLKEDAKMKIIIDAVSELETEAYRKGTVGRNFCNTDSGNGQLWDVIPPAEKTTADASMKRNRRCGFLS